MIVRGGLNLIHNGR